MGIRFWLDLKRHPEVQFFSIRHVAALLSKVATLLAGTSGCIFNSSRPFSSENGSKMDETGKMEAMAHLVQWFTQASWWNNCELFFSCRGSGLILSRWCWKMLRGLQFWSWQWNQYLSGAPVPKGGHQPASWQTVESKEELKKKSIYDTVTFR